MTKQQQKESGTTRKPKCDWCDDEENQKYLADDWCGHIYLCLECSHEYLIPAMTQKGDEFWEFLKKTVQDTTAVSTADTTTTSESDESKD